MVQFSMVGFLFLPLFSSATYQQIMHLSLYIPTPPGRGEVGTGWGFEIQMPHPWEEVLLPNPHPMPWVGIGQESPLTFHTRIQKPHPWGGILIQILTNPPPQPLLGWVGIYNDRCIRIQ